MKAIGAAILVWVCLIPGAAYADSEGAKTRDVHAEGTHPEKKREECPVCGMYIDQYLRSAAELTYKDGEKKVYTCGVACMLRVLEDEGIPTFSSIKVRDWKTGNLVDADKAAYSIGSRVIPDMIPNFIAFESREGAEAFKAKEGGGVLDFNKAMQIITPRGQTVPARVQPAVTPAKGSFGMGIGFSYGQKDRVKIGSDTQDPDAFIGNNAQQLRAPSAIESYGQSLFANYGITDRLAVLVNVPFFEKQSSQYNKNPGTGAITTAKSDTAGLGDLDLRFRYNLWRSTYYDKWFTIQLGTTLPTGKFDKTFIDSPGMQLGAGAPSFSGGLLFSRNVRNWWLHSSALYTTRFENAAGYRGGDDVTAAVALHYTPNYNYMFGVEVDAAFADKNENRGVKVGNTGGTRTNLTFVADWRFLNALGGNFSVRASVGLPIYEDLNYQRVGAREQVQLGGGFYGNVLINYATRFPFFE